MKIMITSRSFGKISDEPRKKLENAGFEIVMKGGDFDQEEFERTIPEYDALIIGAHPFPATVLEQCKKLKIICKHGVGLDNIPVEKCHELGIAVCNTPGTNSNAVADLAFGLILASCRNIVRCCDNVRGGAWKTEIGVDVYKKTLGVLGYGAIAKNVIRRAEGFNMNVLIYNHRPRELDDEFKDYARFVTLDELYAKSDIITVHLPLNDDTKDMISTEQISAMKDGVVIVNTARGGIVNEEALYQACKNGKVRAAALDVSVKEPMDADNPLRTLPNVIITPHLGMYSREAINAVSIMCAENAVAMFSGGELKNRV